MNAVFGLWTDDMSESEMFVGQGPFHEIRGLLLLIEGIFTTGQLFGDRGPAMHAVEIAEMMIEASRTR